MALMSVEDRKWLETVAECLEYPGVGFAEKQSLAEGLEQGTTEAGARMGAALRDLGLYLKKEGQANCEERYTQLFDLSPVCTLHLGYHLFGDAYERGELLAGLVRELSEVGLPLAHELPDFLPKMLRLISLKADEEGRELLAAFILLPGLAKINEALKDATDPWSAVLSELPQLIHELVPVRAVEMRERKEAVPHA